MHYDVVIAGGGMVGAALACALSTVPELSVLILDSAIGVKEVSTKEHRSEYEYRYQYDARSITLARGTAEVFHQIGIWSKLREFASPIQEIIVSEKGHFGQSRINAREEKVPALGYVVENHWLMQVFYEFLKESPNISIEAPAVIQSAKANTSGYQVEAFHQQEQTLKQYQASLLVVADGANSEIRDQLGISVERFDYRQSAIVANLTPEKSHEWRAYERFTPSGPLALLPLINNRCAAVWTMTTGKRTDELAGDNDRYFLEALESEFGRRLGTFTKIGQRVVYPLQKIVANEQVRPNLVVLGNAAHTLHPVAGQGFNLSVRDVVALTVHARNQRARCACIGDLGGLLDYQNQRLADQSKITQFSDKLLRLFMMKNLTVGLARNIGLVTFDLWPGAKKMLAKHAMGTLTYISLY